MKGLIMAQLASVSVYLDHGEELKRAGTFSGGDRSACVYVLASAAEEVAYVGITSQPLATRLHAHRMTPTTYQMSAWLDSNPDCRITKVFSAPPELRDRCEQHWIGFGRSQGHLLNKQRGGGGRPTMDPEAKARNLCIKLPPDLYGRVVATAKERGMSVSAVMRNAFLSSEARDKAT